MKYYVVREHHTNKLISVHPNREGAQWLTDILESYDMEFGIDANMGDDHYFIEEVEEFPQT